MCLQCTGKRDVIEDPTSVSQFTLFPVPTWILSRESRIQVGRGLGGLKIRSSGTDA